MRFGQIVDQNASLSRCRLTRCGCVNTKDLTSGCVASSFITLLSVQLIESQSGHSAEPLVGVWVQKASAGFALDLSESLLKPFFIIRFFFGGVGVV